MYLQSCVRLVCVVVRIDVMFLPLPALGVISRTTFFAEDKFFNTPAMPTLIARKRDMKLICEIDKSKLSLEQCQPRVQISLP